MSHTKYISDVLDDQTKTSNGTMLYHISIELYHHLYVHFPCRDGALVVTQDLYTNFADTYYQPLPISKNMTIETNIFTQFFICTMILIVLMIVIIITPTFHTNRLLAPPTSLISVFTLYDFHTNTHFPSSIFQLSTQQNTYNNIDQTIKLSHVPLNTGLFSFFCCI